MFIFFWCCNHAEMRSPQANWISANRPKLEFINHSSWFDLTEIIRFRRFYVMIWENGMHTAAENHCIIDHYTYGIWSCKVVSFSPNMILIPRPSTGSQYSVVNKGFFPIPWSWICLCVWNQYHRNHFYCSIRENASTSLPTDSNAQNWEHAHRNT